MKTICLVTALYSDDVFIKPHYKMAVGVDKRIALIGKRPWPVHEIDHGVVAGAKPEEIIRKYYPDVEIRYTDLCADSSEHGIWETMANFYNHFIEIAKDYDYVTRFDVDMLFTEQDWNKMITFVKNNNYDYYRLNCENNSINYYYDFEHGARDATEREPMVLKTNQHFKCLVETEGGNGYTMEWPEWTCHHFRGWNKPKTYGDINSPPGYFQKMAKTTDFIKCPQEIRDLFK